MVFVFPDPLQEVAPVTHTRKVLLIWVAAHDSDSDTVQNLSIVVTRLQNELREYREREEQTNLVLRERAPETTGLRTTGAVKAVLNTRDALQAQVEEQREFIREITSLARDDGNLKRVYERLVIRLHSGK